MSEAYEETGKLNRECRRQLSRHLKSISNETQAHMKESALSTINTRATDILKKDTPFEIELGDEKSDIFMAAAYLTCSELSENDITRLKEVFFNRCDTDKLYKNEDLDTNVETKLVEDIAITGETLNNYSSYIEIYSMCNLDNHMAMQTAILSSVSISMYEIMKNTFKPDIRTKKKTHAPVKSGTGNGVIEPAELNPLLACWRSNHLKSIFISVMVYWAGKNKLIDKNSFKSEMQIDFSEQLHTFLEKNIGECVEYVKWAKGEITLKEAIIASNDSEGITDINIGKYMIRLEYVGDTLIAAYSRSDKLKQNTVDIARLEKDNAELSNKYANMKKLRSEAQKELKQAKRRISELETRLAKTKKDNTSKNKQKTEDKQDIISKLHMEIGGLKDELEVERNSIQLQRAKFNEQSELLNELDKELRETKKLYDDIQEYAIESMDIAEMNYDIPLQHILQGIVDLKIAICGGKDHVVNNLEKMGVTNIKHIPVGKSLSIQEVGQFECLVIMTKYVSHKSVYLVRDNARNLGKPIVYFNGSNIEQLCRQIFEGTR